uniref:Amino acid adenylation domain-containing protein n=1 Tax=Candidatus Kentrum sp. UNK TaxID=2126344 RepID=A0A451AZ95_9GAMM|nr:MAG: amino acid adenylation domain-containing protein [Candidatus Kentron sp. UNK]VFK71365.1 MAG: amino acid adenylation domain-containing protein [Candidatus Kentron sp. UNK]
MDHSGTLNLVEFLDDLAARGEGLALIDGQLHYHAPGGAAQREAVQTIRAHKAALVAWLQGENERPRTYPLSAGQQGIWMAWRLDPGVPIYNLFLVARLKDEPDLSALRQALAWLVERHPALRTRYPLDAVGSAPLQIVEDEPRVELPAREVSGWTDEQVARWIEAEADRPFDLAQGPVMRAQVLRVGSPSGDARHSKHQNKNSEKIDACAKTHPVCVLARSANMFFHWTLHHIASDFLSQEVLIEDLDTLYRAARAGKPPEAADAGLDYRAFVRWEQDILAAQGERLRAFWRKQVENWPQAPTLPVDLAPTHAASGAPERDYRAATFDFAFDPALAESLRGWARERQVSLFVALLTAYQIVIGRYGGQERFVITTPTSVRHLAGWARAAGYLINPLCFMADLGGDPSVAGLLERTQRHLGACFEHQMFPYSEVLRLRKVAESSGGGAIPTIGFILDAARQPARAPSLFAETVAIGQRGAPEALSLSIFDMAGELSGQVTYDANRFMAHTIERLMGYLRMVIEGMIEGPRRSVSALSLLTRAERAMILDEWSTNPATLAGDAAPGGVEALPLPVQFARQARQTPARIALIQCDENGRADAGISYRDLDAWSDEIARRLHAEGARRGTLVGVFMARSSAMIAGLLGILKVGGAYLPLDPAYPRQRLEYMLRDSGAALLLTQEDRMDAAPASNARVIRLTRDPLPGAPIADKAPSVAVSADVTADDLAYVIYTSGSTGQPKGVEAMHGAAANRLAWMWRALPFAPDDVCCQKTALSFVDSVWEIFGPLLRGVSSVIIPDRVVKDIPRLLETLARQGVTRIVLVPSLLRALLDTGLPLAERLPRLRWWVCSGETLPVDLVRRFQARLPEARLINLYGSSEVAADVTWYDTAAFEEDGRMPARVPIGQPITNTGCWILDRRLEPAPPGIEGELYVGGVCLARGYRGRPELTGERFIANPFAPGRLFRTGDRARWRPLPRVLDGDPRRRPDMEFCGRNDTQVKIRGFRVELAEIEARLRQHPSLDDALVLLREHPSGPHLVAYAATASPPSPTDLYHYLRRDLPDYMVPGAFVLLERLPSMPNGKVDRQALARLDPAEPLAEPGHEPPTTDTERALAALWAEGLGRARVGRHDNFFALGGHSLMATQIVTRIQSEFAVALPAQALFDHPTIAALATRIQARQLASRLRDDPAIGADHEMDILL